MRELLQRATRRFFSVSAGRAALVLCGLFSLDRGYSATNAPAESWLGGTVQFPGEINSSMVETGRFTTARAEYLAGVVKVFWTAPDLDGAAQVTLRLSVDEPGHWPVRDWRSFTMSRRGPSWDATVPVDSLDVPLIYFIEARNGRRLEVSPMRICRPRLLGLEQPTRFFWWFVEGFEEGLESWRYLAGNAGIEAIRTSNLARNGKKSLLVTVPPGKASVTLGTTRLRGWYVAEHGASGVRFWTRTSSGNGQVRCTCFANAFSTNQTVSMSKFTATVRSDWGASDFMWDSFPRFDSSQLDFIAIELVGSPGQEFFLDDLQLLGPWSKD